MKTVLIYVISAQIPPYGAMVQQAKDTWDSEELEGTLTHYYSGAPERPTEDRVVYFPVEEDYKTMGFKDILGYEWALKNLKWDYMARVNSSCYVHKRRLRDEVQSLPNEGVFRGVTLGPTYVCGTTRNWMWGGCQFIISRDVVESMMRRKSAWRHEVMEDVAMSELVQDAGYTMDGGGRCCSINYSASGWSSIAYGSPIGGLEFTDFSEVNRMSDQYFFRVKNDADRSVDGQVMRLLKQHLTP